MTSIVLTDPVLNDLPKAKNQTFLIIEQRSESNLFNHFKTNEKKMANFRKLGKDDFRMTKMIGF